MDVINDKRHSRRQVVSVRAEIEVLGRPRMVCWVRNISEGGALIDLVEKTGLPRSFGLRLANSSVVLECEITHATKNNYGVVFKPQDGISGAAMKRAIRNAQEQMGDFG